VRRLLLIEIALGNMAAMDDVLSGIPKFPGHFGNALASGLEYLLPADSLMKPLSDCRLYTFVDTAYLHGRSPESIARQLCDGGSDIIQLRAKESSEEEIRSIAEKLFPICQNAGARLVINDHPQIAIELARRENSDRIGCHLGQEDFFDAGHSSVPAVRAAFRSSPAHPECFIGLSSHAPVQAERAIQAGADYIAIGPIYATATKPSAKPVTLDYVRWAATNIKIPWFAIGGVNLDTLDAVLAAGAKRICVVSAILNSDDVAAACAEIKRRLN
jgi:thiamine-phosphate pyrophosphorylase